MRNNPGSKRVILRSLPVMLLAFLGLVSCGSPLNGSSFPNTHHVVIDWVNFIRFNGITYLAGPTKPGRSVKASDLGPVFATVRFKLEGNVQDPNYQSKDGDAAFLDAGTKIYSMQGYSPNFRLIAQQSNALTLYEADTNPRARKGADLLDIGRKVDHISIVSAQDGVTELGTIKNSEQVATLVSLILTAPVKQNHQAGNQQYALVFYLLDGTVVMRTYWLDTGELSRGILLSQAFGQAIKAALAK